jgi:uncharacterized phage infection (PIP) family protein YhgE
VAPAASQAEQFLATQPDANQHQGLVDVAAALSAIASLDELAGDAPDTWQGAEEPIRGLAASTDQAVAQLAVTAGRAADQVQDVLADATAAYDTWAAENEAAVDARDTAIASATSYQEQMSALLSQYADLRNQLSSYIEQVQTSGSTVDEGYRQFAEASQARRTIRDQMAAQTPPAAADPQHARLLAIMQDAIAGVEAAERGLDERECTIYGCNVFDQPSFQHFRSESQRISTAFADATSSWQDAAQTAVDQARAIELPDKPDF